MTHTHSTRLILLVSSLEILAFKVNLNTGALLPALYMGHINEYFLKAFESFVIEYDVKHFSLCVRYISKAFIPIIVLISFLLFLLQLLLLSFVVNVMELWSLSPSTTL